MHTIKILFGNKRELIPLQENEAPEYCKIDANDLEEKTNTIKIGDFKNTKLTIELQIKDKERGNLIREYYIGCDSFYVMNSNGSTVDMVQNK